MPGKSTLNKTDKIKGSPKSIFKDTMTKILPDDGMLNACLTCEACVTGCPASGLEKMDPKKFLRLAAEGMDKDILNSNWVWMCSMCARCTYVCPLQIDIPRLVFEARAQWKKKDKPAGITRSCDMALTTNTCSAMGAEKEDFQFLVEDVLEEYQESQPEFARMHADIDKKGAFYFLNQNSREPVNEPDEMVPLWKILHLAGADWTYGSKGWAAENYCLFSADDENWEKIVRKKVEAVEALGCKVWLNTE